MVVVVVRRRRAPRRGRQRPARRLRRDHLHLILLRVVRLELVLERPQDILKRPVINLGGTTGVALLLLLLLDRHELVELLQACATCPSSSLHRLILVTAVRAAPASLRRRGCGRKVHPVDPLLLLPLLLLLRVGLGGEPCELVGQVRLFSRERARQLPHVEGVRVAVQARTARALGQPRPGAGGLLALRSRAVHRREGGEGALGRAQLRAIRRLAKRALQPRRRRRPRKAAQTRHAAVVNAARLGLAVRLAGDCRGAATSDPWHTVAYGRRPATR